ncbi:hypothetical protein, partial [Methylorubrum podarium]|uniref:hypothetical protein n=1 Tax=Methylorubrum podarium TaxID=200476 RepID=UPI001EE29BB0
MTQPTDLPTRAARRIDPCPDSGPDASLGPCLDRRRLIGGVAAGQGAARRRGLPCQPRAQLLAAERQR